MYKDKEFQDNVLRISTLLKARDVAEILQISRSMAYNLMQIGEIPTVRIGKCSACPTRRFDQVHREQYIPVNPILKRIES